MDISKNQFLHIQNSNEDSEFLPLTTQQNTELASFIYVKGESEHFHTPWQSSLSQSENDVELCMK